MGTYRNIPTFNAENRQVWRSWLLKNHSKVSATWLIIYKKDSGKASITYKEAVEEALCFGWIDSKPNKRDAESYYQYFAPRNPKSGWSKINKAAIEKLMASHKMMPAGLRAMELAKKNGAWNALDEVDNHHLPHDLREALGSNEMAARNFEAFPKSSKKIILEWIHQAKKPETRLKRIEETVSLATRNIRANHYRQ